jgi:CheY-like chemotaxis protein
VPEKPSLSPAGARILLIEDDPHLGAQMDTQLRGAGYSIRWLRDGAEAPDLDEQFDLVLLDLMLPTSYGLDVLKDLRVRSEVPVIIVTARGDPAEKVRSFQLGADDYVTKPFWPEELLARVRARLRRPRLERAGELVVGDLCIEPAERRVRLRGEVIPCTPRVRPFLAPGSWITRSIASTTATNNERWTFTCRACGESSARSASRRSGASATASRCLRAIADERVPQCPILPVSPHEASRSARRRRGHRYAARAGGLRGGDRILPATRARVRFRKLHPGDRRP